MTDAQNLAQQWHDREVERDPNHDEFSSCWCCCEGCDPDWATDGGNPHWEAAQSAIRQKAAQQ